MNRWKLILFALPLLPSGIASGQAPYNPYAPAPLEPSARERRAARERAVARIGPVARSFVEKYGDDACASLNGTSKAVGIKLCEFHNAGELGKLAKPSELLKIIASKQGGDDLVLFAIQHSRELAGDIDQLDALLASPGEYALGLKELAEGAAESRARRLTMKAQQDPPALTMNVDQKLFIGGCGIVIGIGVILIWMRWRQSSAGYAIVHG